MIFEKWYIFIVRPITVKKFIKNTSGLDRFLILLALIGVIVALISLFRGIIRDSQVQVEFLADGETDQRGNVEKIFVDIEGAVINSGVYELSIGSRVKDVLIMAGGLSGIADRSFCEKNINMAEEVKDGQKIYIPKVTNTNAPSGYGEAKSSSKTVNVNTGTITELDTLWGIGEAKADSIVKNRPYQNVEELVTKGVLTQNLLDKNREMISVF